MDDPIRDQNSRPESADGSTYSASESGSFSGSPEGTGYTTPTGGYGYAYSPEPEPEPKGGKRTIIIVSAIVTAVLLCGCVLLGAMLVRSSCAGAGQAESGTDSRTDSRPDTAPATKAGSFIVIDPSDTESGEAAPVPEDTTAPGTDSDVFIPATENVTESNTVDLGASTIETAPATATVIKKSPSRSDADSDGRADVELDERGLVITSAGKNVLPVSTIVYRVADSVVEITTETISRSSYMGQYVTSGAGSGVIISKEGLIVTNNHVIEGADSITVRLTDGTTYSAALIGTDEQTDVALLWIDAGDRELTVAAMGASYDLVVGEDIIAIGNPLGSLGGTVTEGIVSATARSILVDGSAMTLLQVSCPISPGNSGGGLFNMAGELIGVVNPIMSKTDVEGLGFAIPIDTAYEIMTELYGYGYVRGRPSVGVTLVDVTSSWTALQYFRSQYTGVYVYDREAQGPLEYGDLVLSVDGVKVSSVAELNAVIKSRRVGDEVEFTVYRGGETVTVSVILTEYVPERLRNR